MSDDMGQQQPSMPLAYLSTGSSRRASKACDACRKGKVRCGGQKPACARCLENGLECFYSSPRLKRGPEKGSVPQANQRMKQRLDHIEDMLHDTLAAIRRQNPAATPQPQMQEQVPGSLEHATPPSEASRSPAAFLAQNAQSSNAHRTWSSSLPSPSLTGPPRSDRPPSVAAPNNKRPRADHESDSATSTTSPLPLLPVDAYFRYPSSRSDRVLSRSAPNGDIALHLIDTYFLYVHNQQYGFLHRETLQTDFLQKKAPLMLIYSICAVSARYSDHPLLKHDPPYESGENFAAEAVEIIMRTLDQPDLTMLQSLLLLCVHAAGAGKGAQAWMLGGMAFRLCYALRLDKACEASEDRSWHHEEIRRRTFWTAFLVDRFSGAGSDAPNFLQVESATQTLPASERCFLDGMMAVTPCIFGDSGIDDHDLGCFAYEVRLAELWGRLARYVNHARSADPPDLPSSPYTSLKRELDHWLASLPEQLMYSPKNLAAAASSGEAGSLAFMHILHHAARSFIEQPVLIDFRENLPTGMITEAEMTSCQNAIACCEVYSRSTVVYDNLLSTPLTAYFLFSSGVILARQSFLTDTSLAHSIQNCFSIALLALDRLEKHWAPVKRYNTTLRAYHSACKRSLPRRHDGSSQTLPSSHDPSRPPADAIAPYAEDYDVTTGANSSHQGGVLDYSAQNPLQGDSANQTFLPVMSWPSLAMSSYLDDDVPLLGDIETWNSTAFDFQDIG